MQLSEKLFKLSEAVLQLKQAVSCAAHDEQLKLFIFIEAEGNIARAIFPSNNS